MRQPPLYPRLPPPRMSSAPEYRFVFHVVDERSDTVVISGSTYLSSISVHGECESVDMEVGSVLRAFERKVRERYEAKHYPTEEETI